MLTALYVFGIPTVLLWFGFYIMGSTGLLDENPNTGKSKIPDWFGFTYFGLLALFTIPECVLLFVMGIIAINR